jgi:signal transduction histidine kinase
VASSSPSAATVGSNYLESCRRAAARSEPGAAAISACIEAVLAGTEPLLSVEYSQPSADGEKWFAMNVTPLTGAGGGAVIVHLEITERRRLEAEVLQIAETERQRVAADLHDGICQELSGIGFTAAALCRQLARAGNPIAARVEKLEKAIVEAVGHTRQVARGLNAVVADGHGLMHALGQLATTMSKVHRLRCRFSCRTPIEIHDPVAANELYRIAQEAMSNAARHARATRMTVILMADEAFVHLVIGDNGQGLPPDLSKVPGMGLRVMKYRATLIGGSLSVQSRRRAGTIVWCSVPKTAHLTSQDDKSAEKSPHLPPVLAEDQNR